MQNAQTHRQTKNTIKGIRTQIVLTRLHNNLTEPFWHPRNPNSHLVAGLQAVDQLLSRVARGLTGQSATFFYNTPLEECKFESAMVKQAHALKNAKPCFFRMEGHVELRRKASSYGAFRFQGLGFGGPGSSKLWVSAALMNRTAQPYSDALGNICSCLGSLPWFLISWAAQLASI